MCDTGCPTNTWQVQGAPNGPAVKSEWTYTREFEYAWVNLDIQNEQAEIIWGTKK